MKHTRSMALDPLPYEQLEEQTQEKFGCNEHEVVKVRNAIGRFVCPLCLIEEGSGDMEGNDGNS